MDEPEQIKVGRIKVEFPTDVTTDELRLASVIVFSYIQAQKTKGEHPAVWVDKEEKKVSTGVG